MRCDPDYGLTIAQGNEAGGMGKASAPRSAVFV